MREHRGVYGVVIFSWICFGQTIDPPAAGSLSDLLARAGKGEAAAEYSLGRMYVEGRDVARDFGQAARWYRKAGDQGYAEAENALGILYDNGQGVPQDHAEAARWYRKAADRGDPDAAFDLGVMYEEGQGVARDDSE